MCSEQTPSDFGEYRVQAELGRGGFATVYLAEDAAGQKVAVKVLHRAGDIDRFNREAKVLAGLECENTVRLLDHGTTSEGEPYMVCEYVAGEDLEAFLERNDPLPWQAAVEAMVQLLTSLEEAHAKGIVHRDLKPANVLLTSNGQVKLLDFGLVRLLPDQHDVTALTKTGTIMGTPRYMAPEVIRGTVSASPAVDIFGVGMIGYELLAGEQANNGRSVYEVFVQHLDPAPYELPERVDVPYPIRAWLNSLIRKDPARRISTAREALADLDERTAQMEAEQVLGPHESNLIEFTIDRSDEPVPRPEPPRYRLGEFELDEELGLGVAAAVWSARHQRFDGGAAVKLMLAGRGMSELRREAFFTEARAHAGLEHPNIVRLLDYGHVSTEDLGPHGAGVGDPYLVMERAEGTLRDAAAPASWTQVADVLHQILAALAYSHARGVVHRDLKPDNVLRFADGSYKLSDFGIAHSMQLDEQDSLELLELARGTPQYMSPEQFRAHWYEYGPATDLYAVGCLAFELICGRVPFGGTGWDDLARQHEYVPMPEVSPRFTLPDGVEGWLSRLLQKRSEDRFQWAADAAHALRELTVGFVETGTEASEEFLAPGEPTHITGELPAVVRPGDGAAPRAGFAELRAVVPAPQPATWPDRAVGSADVAEGIGLFALRPIPIAGLKEERSALWSELRQTGGEMRLVMLTGEERAPVNEVGEWFAVSAAEAAAARPITVVHTQAGGRREGLARALEDIFGTWAMADGAAVSRVWEQVSKFAPGGGELLASDSTILAQEILRGRGATDQPRAVSQFERFGAVARLLASQVSDRPLLLFLGDLQWSSETTAFARYLLEHENHQSLLVVLGRSGRASRAAVDRELDALGADPRCTVVEVEPYDDGEFAAFANDLLLLEPAVVEELAASTGRDPLLAHLVVTDLVRRDALTRGARHFAPTSALQPNDLSPTAVIIRLLGRLPDDAQSALSVCGVLGSAPDAGELEAVCERIGVTVPFGLAPMLEEVGLARTSAAGWWFSHHAVVDCVTASSCDDLDRIRVACGEVSLERTAPDDAAGWMRAARYFVAAGAADRALEPMNRAVRLLVTRDMERTEALLDERAKLLRELDKSADSFAAIDQLNLSSLVSKVKGNTAEARALTEQAQRLARENSYIRGLARALRDNASFSVDGGMIGQAAASFAEAASLSAALGDALDEGHAWFGAAFVAYRRANLAEAQEYYDAAIARFESVGARQAQARAMSYLSAVYVAAGRFDEARETATQAQEIARACGALAIVTETKSDLAEIARFSGDYRTARTMYEEAARWQRLAGLPSSEGAAVNLAFVALGERRYEEALRALQEAEKEFVEREMMGRLAPIRVALAVALFGAGDSAAAHRTLEASRDLLASAEPERDVAWALECGVHAAADPAREWFRTKSAQEYTRLGDVQSAERVKKI